ncbi:proteasome stabiliser-domain-containing protein [Halteromyces radiatus]|uniref:proteasome stabiliser-domain-containing protein n=1 Tax=Halteromyces radiatus TaxID=101107 RepID=UPI00221F0E6F|nr:proteasome stabiliser-domain-containing protein [Halteromyces radiatus]KAI8088970.1 proteasome stabiliser-domain-containing protein [Halteromyces radiatus]
MANNEIQLLENVELKLAMCSTDSQLEKTIGIFLPPVLLKLSSTNEQSRKKVMDILSHINKRIKSNDNVKLPFDSLLDQFSNNDVSNFVKNFTIIYLEMCVKRLTPEETAVHIPKFLQGISKRPVSQRITLLHMVLPALKKWTLDPSKQAEARQSIFHFDEYPQDVTVILNFFKDLLLYQPMTPRQASTESEETSPVYPGLSPQAVAEVTNNGKISWTSTRVTEAKLGIIHFILSNVFTDDERLELLIAGVCDANHMVVSACEDGIRRWTNNVDLENKEIIQSLYTLYLGTKPTTRGDGKDGRAPVSSAVKIRILYYLGKSIVATNFPTQMIQVVFDGIYGESSSLRLRRSTMAFLQWCARMCDSSTLAPVAPIIVSGMLKYIDQNPFVSGHDAESIKGYAYVVCGLVIRKVPKIGLEDTQIISLFFDNIVLEQPNVRVYVQDALSSMIDVYAGSDSSSPIYHELQDIILKAVEQNNANSRYMALKYANGIYPFSLPFARYVCLLGTSSSINKLEVHEEATRGLHPFLRDVATGSIGSKTDIVPPSALPTFAEMVNYLAEHRPGEQYIQESRTPVIKGYPTEVYAEILAFLRMILVLEANPDIILIDEYVQDKVENSMSEDPIAMENVKQILKLWWKEDSSESVENGRRAIEIWLNIVENALDSNLKDPVLTSTAAKCLLEMISLGPSSIANVFKPRLSLFKSFTTSNKLDTRLLMSHIFGIIASDSGVPQQEVEDILLEFGDILEEPETKQNAALDIDRKHGSLLAIGHLLGRCYYRKRSLRPMVVTRCINLLLKQLDGIPSSTFYLLAGAACQALAEIGRTQSLDLLLQLDQQSESSKDVEMTDDNESATTTKMTSKDVLDKLALLAKSSKDTKLQENAILALGHLSIPLVINSDSTLVDTIVAALFATADTKQVELYFAGGEAWTALAFGWNSQALQKYKDISDIPALDDLVSEQSGDRSAAFQNVVETIVKTYVTSDRSWYRKAACIWLLSILKFGKDQDIIKTNLGVIHASFSRLLSDRDDFTQEVASKGLGLVYEYGDAKIKEDMLYSLVGTFTEGRSIQAQSVTDNTVLFEEGALGTTPDGNSITTYKELCSLASELNQPDLIYKFMNLANHNAMWTSRRGAAFGFQNLMALAEKEMEPYLPRLIPKLYRYQFDPNPRVNQSMKSIWQSLVKDSQKTVDKYFNEIIDDVLKGLGNRQWRVREASCAAVTDLVQGRQLAQIEPYLESLWQMCFRALDDIKGSVRQAATQTCKQLTKLTVHYCDPEVVSPQDGGKVMDIVMPFLLHKGIVSDAEDVRKFSLDAVLKVCKTGASLLKKYIPDLVDTLLQSLSSLESQTMNYLSFHVEQYNISQEQLDNARLSGAKNSPMMEGIEHCVNQIDEEVMAELVPRIIQIVKKGTGLPTKAGCARFIVTLCMNRRAIFEPHADNFLKALSGAIRSKNPVIRKTFATATGYVCQLATYDRLLSLTKHLKKLYVEEEDEDSHAAAAVTAVEITRFATDRMNSIASDIVPLIYFGEHDPDEQMKKLWQSAWENLTSGTRSFVTLYADEILQFTQPLLNSSSWKIKQTAALTIADMCKSGGKGIEKHLDKLMPVMVSTLATRSWNGKETVLDAFSQLCVSSKSFFDEPTNQPSLADVAKIFIRESKRNNRVYQRHALVSLDVFLEAFSDKIDIFGQVQDFLTDLCCMDEAAAMEEDDEDDNTKPLLLMIKANAFKALTAGYQPKVYYDQEKYADTISDTLTTSLQGNIWNVQLAILQSLQVFIEHSTPSSLNNTISSKIVKACGYCLDDLKYTAIRTASIDVLDILVNLDILNDELKSSLRSKVNSSIHRESIALLKERLQQIAQKLN